MATFTSLLFVSTLMYAQDKGTFRDIRDGLEYRWMKVGNQTWMTGNLKFRSQEGSWVYDNDSANEVNLGRLYSWKAAQAACPKGWHVPTEKEWGALVQSLGGSGEAGNKLNAMDTIVKVHPGAGQTASVIISTLLGGVRHPDGSYSGMNVWGGCWTSGKVNDTVATNILFAKGFKDAGFSTNDKKSGFSVRCLKGK